MRIAFLAEAKGRYATERRRIGHLWRALFRIQHAFPTFIDANRPYSGSQGSSVPRADRVEDVWDIVVNATNDPNAADAYYATVYRVWAPPSDASAINPLQRSNFDAIWSWEDGPLDGSHALAEHVLPDIYESALDHSIATYPDGAILADSLNVEKWSHGIAGLLKADAVAETGIPVALAQQIVRCPDFDQLSVAPYENIEALGRSSVLVSDFSTAYRDLAIAVLRNGAKVILIGLGKDIVLGGRRYRIPQLENEFIAGGAIEWSDTQQRTIDDLTTSVKSALQSISSGAGFGTTGPDRASTFECELKTHSFNPHTRLLIAVVSCRSPMVNDILIEGLAIVEGGGGTSRCALPKNVGE